MIYDVLGNVISQAYNTNGLSGDIFYDFEGNIIYNISNPDNPSDPDTPPVSSDNIIRVMSYNIGLFTGRNTLETLQHMINTYNLDLIGLQEVYKTSLHTNFSKAFGDYPYYLLGAQYNKNAILSKLPLEDMTSVIYDYNTLETKAYTKGYFMINGIRVCFIDTHLEQTAGGEAKVRQAKQLQELVQQEEYFIITGDFNTICKDTSHEEYELIMKPFLDMGCHSVNCSPEFGFTNTWTDQYTLTESNGYPTDHIIVSKNIKIVNHVYDTYKLDLNIDWNIDHIPVIAEVKILSAEEQTIFMLNDKSYTVEKGTTWRQFAENPFYEITIDDTKVFKSLIPVVDSDNNYITPDQEIRSIVYTTYNA